MSDKATTQSNGTKYLFVYGTLLADLGHPMGALLTAHGELVSQGSIQACLYIIEEEDAQGTNTYPGAVPSPFSEDRVHGALYKILDPEQIFPAFNEFEACAPGWPEPYEFLLRPIDVLTQENEVIRAQSYLYTWDTSRATRITSGRYNRPSADVR